MSPLRSLTSCGLALLCTSLIGGVVTAQSQEVLTPRSSASQLTKDSARPLAGAGLRGLDAETCPGNSLGGQDSTTPASDWVFGVADVDFNATGGIERWDNYTATGNICAIRFWGLQLLPDFSNNCAESPANFTIQFYANNGGMPAAAPTCNYSVQAVPAPTGISFNGFELLRFEASLTSPSCCSLTNGFVYIQATGGSDCLFLWAASGDDHSADPVPPQLSWIDANGGVGLEPEFFDLSFCLLSGPSAGACCMPNGSCQQLSSNACAAAGGIFQGDGVSCSPNPCSVTTNDTCATALTLPTIGTVMTNNLQADDDVTPVCNNEEVLVFASLWYSFVGDGSEYTVTTCNPGTDIDTVVQVFCDCVNLTCVGGADQDAICGTGAAGMNASTFTFCSAPGQTYFIQVGSFDPAQRGRIEIKLTQGSSCNTPPSCGAVTGRCCLSDAAPACPGDIAGAMQGDNSPNGVVNLFDLLTLLSQWGGSGSGDIAGAMQNDGMPNGVVNLFDLLTLLANWGACPARGGGSCVDGLLFSQCTSMGGVWAEGTCAANPCPNPLCLLPDGVNAATSDTDAGTGMVGIATANNLTPAEDVTVTSVKWWGVYSPCQATLPTDAFTITYFGSVGAAGGPDLTNVIAGPFNVTPSRTNTGDLIINGAIIRFEYEATHAPVMLEGGEQIWVQIQNSVVGTCTWFWETTSDGDGVVAQRTGAGAYGLFIGDTSISLNGACPPLP